MKPQGRKAHSHASPGVAGVAPTTSSASVHVMQERSPTAWREADVRAKLPKNEVGRGQEITLIQEVRSITHRLRMRGGLMPHSLGTDRDDDT